MLWRPVSGIPNIFFFTMNNDPETILLLNLQLEVMVEQLESHFMTQITVKGTVDYE